MVELRGTQRTLCVMLLLLQAAVRGQTPPDPRFHVRAGDDVTLPSNRVDQDRCNGSTWLHSRTNPAVELVTLGKINNNTLIPEAKTNRLSLTANCSLVIRNVSGEDVGRYTNRDYDEAGKQQGADGVVSLYVFTIRGQTPPDPHFLVRAGDDVTLPSNRVNQDRCDGSYWLYSRSGSTVELVKLGKINNDALIPEAKTNRLSLTANCSLVIRNVSGEGVGRYTNRDFNEAGKQQGPDGVVSLYVFTMEEKDYGGSVEFSCFVLRFSECEHTPEWLYDGKQTDVTTSHAACEATVTFKAPPHQKSKYYKSLRCEVRDDQSGKTLLFEACSQFSCEQTVSGQTPPDPRFLVRAGDDVTLPSNRVDQDRCDGSTWLYSRSGSTVELFNLGKIKNNALIPEAKTNRLSLTANCSLVIRNVSGEDVGLYINRDYDETGKQQGPDGVVSLYVFTMEEKDYGGLVVFSCLVLRFSGCEHGVEWLYDGKQTDVTTSHAACEATVTFKAPFHQKSKYYKSLRCEVRDNQSGKTLLFEACSQFSCEQTGGPSGEGNITPPAPPVWWPWLVIPLVGLLVLFIILVVFIRWRNQGKRTQTDENNGMSSQLAGIRPGSEPRQDAADPEEGVAYASVSYTRTAGGGAPARVKDGDDGDDVVTYCTVKAPPPASSSGAGASVDPSDLYAVVNKPNK
ncbi:uncharacterized protein LOC120808254 isoform X3 [Gasterosteus aculeatus]